MNDRSDARIDDIEKSLNALLSSIFGTGTIEYDRYHWQVIQLDTALINMMHQTPIHEVREGLHRGISTAKAHL